MTDVAEVPVSTKTHRSSLVRLPAIHDRGGSTVRWTIDPAMQESLNAVTRRVVLH
jgi:hypothetical protein